jgi:uncharacterized lipoprotein YmbA
MRTLLILAVAIVLTACSTQPISRTTYLLRSDQALETRPLQRADAVCLGEVTVASYLDQPGLVLEQASGTVHIAQYHQWAEPLRVSLRQFLSTEISVALGADVALSRIAATPARRIDVTIDKLHGDAQGNAVLVAYWSVNDADSTAEYQFVQSAPLEGAGYVALVAAEKQLLQALAQSIAQGIQ